MTDHVKIYGITPRIQYTADGTLTEYEFPFAIFKTSDINVYFGNEKQESSSYTVSEARHSDGGTVTFASAPASGTVVTIVRNLSIERTSDFQEGSTLRAKVLNDELDYQIACQQQIAENLNRSMVLPPYATGNNLDLTLPMPSAGKAIVWNSAGTNLENSTVSVNALEQTLKGYKTAAQTAATTATNKADTATSQAQTATTQAGIATTKASEAISAVNQLNGIRTNCITEISQDINLTLSSGTLTLKSGSKVTAPNGNQLTVSEDKSGTLASNGQYFVFASAATGSLQLGYTVTGCGSGSSLPEDGTTYNIFLNTSDNKIYRWSNSAWSVWNVAFPLAIITVSDNAISSIDQVFNGFGYIGSLVFVLPGTKGLIPTGRNTDGTFKNTSFSVSSVRTANVTSTTDLRIGTSLFQTGLLVYDELTNYNYTSSISESNKRAVCCPGKVTYSGGAITGLNIKTPFHAIDYNDAVKYTDKQQVTGWGIPDYNKAVSLSTSTTEYTAPNNGFITFTAIGNNSAAKAYVDGSKVFETNSQYSNSNTFPIAKGSVFTRSGGSQISAIVFVPCQGG